MMYTITPQSIACNQSYPNDNYWRILYSKNNLTL